MSSRPHPTMSISDTGLELIRKHENTTGLQHSDVAKAVAAINRLVKVPLNQNQFDALVDLVYSIGEKAFAHSKVLKLLNTGNSAGVPSEIRKLPYSGKSALPEVIKRRDDDAILFAAYSRASA